MLQSNCSSSAPSPPAMATNLRRAPSCCNRSPQLLSSGT